jgi:hypothetical protein
MLCITPYWLFEAWRQAECVLIINTGWKPFATNHDLYWEMEPSGFLLRRNADLLPMIYMKFGWGGTRDHVPLFIRAINSSDIAWFHSLCWRACVTHVGSVEGGKRYLVTEKSFFGLKIPAFPLVVMEWVLVKGVGRETSASDWDVGNLFSCNKYEGGSDCDGFREVGFGKAGVGRGSTVVSEGGSGYGGYREVWFCTFAGS